ncbi:FecR family protein [Sunxiuqinia sp. A32]|uniref:FecR family protein n=1 Tax=Sunxiuqinia sp. A32 TaxID=3461496 RepID=UPI0040455B68
MEPEGTVVDQIVDELTGERNSKAETEGWLNKSPENKVTYSRLQKIWKAAGFISTMNQFNNDHAWTNLNQSIQNQNYKKLKMQKIAYALSGMAASLILILSLGFYTGLLSVESNHMQLATGYGSQTSLTLPDGSEVTLNSGSEIDYHFNKVSGTREVSFGGEAFFEVAKSKAPFIIHTSEGMNVKVLGTSFNLSAYPEDIFIETTLVEGKVELTNSICEKLILLPGQVSSYNRSTKELTSKETNLTSKMGWLNHKIYLDNTSLSNLSKKLERRFDVQIKLIPRGIGEEIHYTGVLEEVTVMDVFNALSVLSDINYEIKGREIIVMKK